ncbi:MAG TPA: hypothetical protein VG754_05060 [Verrucomicrobiae bacterium]|jgi:hypothetical protein|nr:hypothetical protein [Verrucomicrobiae bacterium]
MNDTTKILCAVGLGIYSSAGIYFYSVLVSRTQNLGLRLFLYLGCVALFIFGGLVGCAALWGDFDHDRQKPTSHESNIAHFVLALWLGIFVIYIVLDGRRILRRIRGY